MPPPPPLPRRKLDTTWEIAGYLSMEDLARCCQVLKAWRNLWAESLWAESLWSQYEWDSRKRSRLPVEVFHRTVHRQFLQALWTTGGEGEEGGSEVKGAVAVVVGEEDAGADAGADADGENEHQPIGPMSSLSTRTLRTAGRKKTGKNQFFRDGPRLAVFSDYLMTLVFALDHMSSEYIMHWLGLAARNGRLSLPRLKNLILGQGDIYYDIPDDVVDTVIPPPPEEYIKRPVAAEPETTSPSSAHPHRRGQPYVTPLETLIMREFDSPSALAKLLRRLPSFSTLKISYLDGQDYLPAIRYFCQGDDFRLRVTRGVALNITENHWAWFFGGNCVYGIIDKIPKTISQSAIMSHQLTGLIIHRASNLFYIGAQALLQNCPNLSRTGLGTQYHLGHPLPKFDSLGLSRHTLHCLIVITDMVMDTSSSSEKMGRGERLYTVAGRNDAMVWPKMPYFSLQCPEQYVTQAEFKVMLTIFPCDDAYQVVGV
ncbi:hypothetical protein BGZ47_002773 [Haplosporangium gracile]|nr:hypothetical protein BGZ47_002773 [Haplosporangium gracile]